MKQPGSPEQEWKRIHAGSTTELELTCRDCCFGAGEFSTVGDEARNTGATTLDERPQRKKEKASLRMPFRENERANYGALAVPNSRRLPALAVAVGSPLLRNASWSRALLNPCTLPSPNRTLPCF